VDKINCCMVGYGGIAEFHTEALRQIDGVRLHTVVGRREEPASEFKARMGYRKSTIQYEEALEDSEIDAVVIASPSEVHYEQTKMALEAKKHVLVEIPLAMSHKGARDLVGLANKSGRQVMVAHTRRFDPIGQFVKDFIASGKAGQVYQHHCYELWLRHENVGWTGYQRSWVDDVLFHHGCHVLDYSLWTIGADVRRIRGELSPLHPKTSTSMDVSMLVRYTNETIATLSLSYNSPQAVNTNSYICEAGTLATTGNKVTMNGDILFENTGGLAESILTQDIEFVDAIREDRPPECNTSHALTALTLLQQVYEQMVTLENEDKYKRRWGL
jgi:2-hydroxy-4-carboxymuconate semialdehyde hemiacetal dehydrogenase